MLGVSHPTQVDSIGANYTFEKRVAKTGGGDGYADVWKRGYFAWEYKSKGGDLRAAYKQLNEYHEALEIPPLLVVCDFTRFEVHTKFEKLPSRVYAFTLDDLLHDRDTPTCALPPLEVLRHIFGDYNQLRPGVASARVTEAAASDFLRLAQQLELERAAALDPPTKERIAHFLMRLVFCLFADSVGLLPNHAFRRLVTNDRFSPLGFNRKLPTLFSAMSEEHGFFGADNIPYFNGGLFTDNSTIELNLADLGILYSASQHDWSHIEPAIFGTLFERSLDQAKRSLIGAHYTSTDDILLLIEPVVIQPLQRRWQTVKAEVLAAIAEENATLPTPTEATNPGGPSSPTVSSSERVGSKNSATKTAKRTSQPRLGLNRPALTLLQNWAAELSSIRILDPACGSGNFLYVALKRLLDLWHEARIFGLGLELSLALDPMPTPSQLFGIEIDFYAHEIASIVVWIGFLQWKHDHGIKDEKEPLLKKLSNIEHADAILRYNAEQKPYEPTWPTADFIIGNPPFLGDKMMRGQMGDQRVTDLRKLYEGRVPGGADLVTYWFEKARQQIAAKQTGRAGLLATNSIRMVGNRPVLARIKETGDIFMAWSDNPWTLDGAAVRISIVAFDDGLESIRVLDGQQVETIHADLTSHSNVAGALPLKENAGLCFLGIMKGGPFDITADEARKMLSRPVNPNGRPNSDVVKRRLGGQDITGRDRGGWIIDFVEMPENEAALYEMPFEYIKAKVKPKRDENRDSLMNKKWWLHGRSRPALRSAMKPLHRLIVTPEVAKHRLFVWMDTTIVPDHTCHVIARQDDYTFGLVHSQLHEVWSLSQGAWMGVGNDPRYSSARTFDTFPFPWPPGTEPTKPKTLA
jgi:hypothetical protein